jgi:CBS domain-containing protein
LIDTQIAPSEVAGWLRAYPPFDALDLDTVQRVAEAIEVEAHPAGTTIICQGAEPVEHLRVVRSGAIEIVHDGRVLDLLGEGELFGHASMLSGLPTGFEARAAEDTICYRIGADVARALLADPAGLRYVARSLLERTALLASDDRDSGDRDAARDVAQRPVGTLIRAAPTVCGPQASIRDVAQRMTTDQAKCAVVDLGDGSLGIMTDRDLRTRVIARGLAGDAPVSAAMSAPAYTCGPDRLAGDVLLDMLDRGFRHFPVVSATGNILGVVEDLDLVASYARSPFFLRQRIAMAESVDEVVSASRELRPTVTAMYDARVAATNIMAVYSVVVDALTRRMIELAVAEAGEFPAPFAWLALGSQARREAMPNSDIDSAIVWFGDVDEGAIRPRLHALACKVVDDLQRCGFQPDRHGATASNRLFVRSLASWQHAARSWIADPAQEKALILASVLVESRPVWGVHYGTSVSDTFRLAERNPALLRLLARFALSYRPPTGFFRGLVVEHTGEHRGRLDLKHGGMLPIVDLARWAGMAAGVTSASTIERLRAAGGAGTISPGDAHTLEDAFELIAALRIQDQVKKIRAGDEVDDYVDPASLSALTRSHLKEAFRAVASIQKRVAADPKVTIP